jgi:aldehyde dehydrogenase (NAD+)
VSSEVSYDKLYIDGEWVSPSSSATLTVTSPNTGERIGSVPEAREADVDAPVDAARRALPGWAATSPAERAAAPRRFATAFDARKEEFAQRVSARNGMPVTVSSQLESVSPSVLLNYYAGLVENQGEDIQRRPLRWPRPRPRPPPRRTRADRRRRRDRALELPADAGVVQVPGGREVGAHLVAHPGIHKVAFTGSTAAGRQIAVPPRPKSESLAMLTASSSSSV